MYKWLQFLPHPSEDSSVVCAVHYMHAKKLFIWSIYPTTLGDYNSINSCINRV